VVPSTTLIDGMRILVVDDDAGVRQAVGRALAFEGYDVVQAGDGDEALRLVEGERPDAMVLDLVMAEVGGLEVCRAVRASGDDLPILVLTARHEVADRVAGLDAGADDYLVKPFALEELLARLRALLRRSDAGADEALRLADLVVFPARRQAERAGEPIELTRTEFNLLELLLRNAGQVLTRDLILERVWGYDFETTSNPLEVYIGYLRRKTEAGGGERLIHTVRGVGYVARQR
jgi:two-component system response regulator MprA